MPRKFAAFLHGFGLAPLPVPAGWHALALRLIVGLGFVQHGWAKLSRGTDGFIAILHAIGAPLADLLGWATVIVEIGGGLSILAGAFVPIVTVPMIVMLLVATFTVHSPMDSARSRSCPTAPRVLTSVSPAMNRLAVHRRAGRAVSQGCRALLRGWLFEDRIRRTCNQTGTPDANQ